MAELAMLADIQRMVYSEEVTRQLHVVAQAREYSQVIDRRSNYCAMPPNWYTYLCGVRHCKPTVGLSNHIDMSRGNLGEK